MSLAMVLLALALFVLIRLGLMFRQTEKRLRAVSALDATKLRESLSKSRATQTLMARYRRTFLTGVDKTFSPAREFLTYQEILMSRFLGTEIAWGRLTRQLPGMFVGLGILGTFIGLTAGIGGFKTSSAQAITASIDSLLGGMSTAFWTSIVGMGTSLLLSIFVITPGLKSVQAALDQVCDALDSAYLTDQIEVMRSMFVVREGSIERTPGEALQSILEKVDTTAKATSSFSTDLSDSLKNFSDTFATKMSDQFSDEMYQMYNDVVEPMIKRIEQMTEQIGQDRKESAGEVVGEIVQKLEATMTGMIEEFRNVISGDAKEELERMSTMVLAAADAFQSLPKVIESSISDLKLFQDDIMDRMHKLAERVDASINAVASIGELRTELSGAAASVQEASVAINQASTAVTASSHRFAEQSDKVASHIERQSAAMESTAKHVQVATDSLKGVDENIGGIITQINTGLREYRDTVGESLGKYLREYSDSIRTYAEKLSGAVENLDESVRGMTDALDSSKKDGVA